MKKFLSKIVGGRGYDDFPEELTDEYVEIDTSVAKTGKTKIMVRPFVVQDFGDIKPILDSLREGMTVALINIKPLKDRDVIEIKRAVSKLKKTC